MTTILKKYKNDIISILLFIIILLIFWTNPLFNGKVFFMDDFEAQFLPIRKFMFDMGKVGKFYLWNPYQFSGQPFLADINTGVFYPPNWLYYFIEPGRGMVFFVVLHFFFAGIFSYLLIRRLKLNPAAAFAGAVFYTFSGGMVFRIVHHNIIAAISLLPLVLLIADYFCEHKNFTWAFFLGLTFSLYLFIGMYQMAQYMFIIVFVYFAAHVDYKKILSGEQLWFINLFIIAVIFSLLITSINTIPAQEFLSRSLRMEGIPYKDASSDSLGISQLLLLFIPDLYGSSRDASPTYFWEICYYIGIIPLMLAIIAPFLPKDEEEKKNMICFGAIAILGILLALGKFSPVYWLFYKLVPFFKSQRVPMRYFLGVPLAMLYFIGFTVDKFSRSIKDYSEKQILNLRYSAALSTVLFVSVLLILRFTPHSSGKGITSFWISGLIAIAAILLLIYKKITAKVIIPILLITLVITQFIAGFGWNPTADRSFFDKRTQIFAPFSNKTPIARIHYFPPLEIKDSLNDPGYVGVSNIVAYNPLVIKNYAQYLVYSDYRVMFDKKLRGSFIKNANMFPVVNFKKKMIGLLNLSAVYKFPSENPPYSVEAVKPGISYPRAFIVHNHKVMTDEQKILEYLRDDKFDPYGEIVLEEEPVSFADTMDNFPLKEESLPVFQKYEPDYMKITVNPQYPGFLFLSEIYFPGWKAKVDGKERKIYRANYTFRGIAVKPGDKNIEVYYDPSSFKTGAKISMTTFFVFIIILIFTSKPKEKLEDRKKKSEAGGKKEGNRNEDADYGKQTI